MSVGLAAVLMLTAVGAAQQAQGHKNTQQRSSGLPQQANGKTGGGQNGKPGKIDEKREGQNPLYEAKDSVAQPKGGSGGSGGSHASSTANPAFKENSMSGTMPQGGGKDSVAQPPNHGTASQTNTGSAGPAAPAGTTERYRPGNNKTTRTPQPAQKSRTTPQ
jgi:hypothetical protein